MDASSREIDKQAWASYLTQVAQEHRDLEISIEIVGGEVGHGIEATDMQLEDLVYDERSDELEIAGSRRVDSSRQVLRHFVSHPRSVWVEEVAGEPAAIEIDHGDGVKTLVRMSHAPELPR